MSTLIHKKVGSTIPKEKGEYWDRDRDKEGEEGKKWRRLGELGRKIEKKSQKEEWGCILHEWELQIEKKITNGNEMWKQDGSAFSELMSFISNHFNIFSSYSNINKCRSVEQLTDSAVYLPLLFRLLNPVVSLLNDNGICNPASCFQSLFPIGQR